MAQQWSLDQVQAEFDRRTLQLERYLASPEGVRLRRGISAALIASAPVVAAVTRKRLPLLGRLAGTATVAAVLVNVAAKIRDWEPSHLRSERLDLAEGAGGRATTENGVSPPRGPGRSP